MPKNTWVTIDLVVAKGRMTISVDGLVRHTVDADFSNVEQRLSIYPSHGSTVMVRSVQVASPNR